MHTVALPERRREGREERKRRVERGSCIFRHDKDTRFPPDRIGSATMVALFPLSGSLLGHRGMALCYHVTLPVI